VSHLRNIAFVGQTHSGGPELDFSSPIAISFEVFCIMRRGSVRPLRRIVRLEILEDRTLLSPVIANGGFESVNIAPATVASNLADIPGWNHTGSSGDGLIWRVGYADGGGSATVAGEGSQFVTLGGGAAASGTSSWDQVISGFTAGVTYTLSFMMAAQTTSSSQSISVDFPSGSATAGQTFTAAASPANYWRDWEAKSMTFVANAASVDVRFSATTPFNVGLDNVNVAPAASPALSTVSLTPSTIAVGGTATVTITARDAAGNQETQGGLPFSFGLSGGPGSGTFSNLVDHNNGTYTATFTGTVPGSVTITATLGGQAITSPLPTVTIIGNQPPPIQGPSSGNVLATLNPTTGVLTITGDIGNNAIHIWAPHPSPIPGVPLLRVSGDQVFVFTLPPSPPGFTSVNATSFTDFTLSSITSININMKGGRESVRIGTTPAGAPAGFDIPNNITITAAGGNDVFDIENVGNTGIGAPPGHLLNKVTVVNTGGNNTVLLKNVVAGEVDVTTGAGNDSITYTGTSDIGTAKIVSGNGNDTIAVTAAPVLALRPQAVGLLSILAGDGNNAILVSAPLGVLSITAGEGDNGITVNSPSMVVATIKVGDGINSISLDNGSMSSASITTGMGPDSIDVSNDIFTGAGLTITDGGDSGFQRITLNNDAFTGGGNLSIMVGDGPGILFMSNDTGIGTATITLGNLFSSVTVGDTPATPVSAKNLTLTAGDFTGTVTLNTQISGAEVVTIGSGRLLIGGAVSVNGSAASLAITLGDNHTLTVGGNYHEATINVGNRNTITVTANITPTTDPAHSGALAITGLDSVNVTVNAAGVAPHMSSLTISLTSNATVLVNGVNTGGDITITVTDNPQSLAAVNTVSNNLTITSGVGLGGTGSSYILVQGAMVNNNLTVNTSNTGTSGDGNYILALIGTLVMDALFAQLGGGINNVFAQNVTSLFGSVDGGSGGSSTYFDLGGNSGYTTSGFAGYY
jgi:hypothetical protein